MWCNDRPACLHTVIAANNIQQDLEMIPFNICHLQTVKMSKQRLGACCSLSMGGPGEKTTPNLGSYFQKQFASFIWRAPRGSLHFINIAAANSRGGFTSTSIMPLKPEGGKCRYNMMIKGDQCLPESWHFQGFGHSSRPRIAHSLKLFISWKGNGKHDGGKSSEHFQQSHTHW